MSIETVASADLSKSKFRLLVNPLRRAIFHLVKPYLAEVFRAVPSPAAVSDLRANILAFQQDVNQMIAHQKEAQTDCSARLDQLERSMQQLASANSEGLQGFKRSLYAAQMEAAAVSNRLLSIERMLDDHFAQICGLRETAGQASFSQVGEDRIVGYIFERLGISLQSIRYLDVGAAFPSGHNNTYLFYKAGAAGYLVEADAEYFDSYKKIRPRDTAVQAAIVPARLKGSGSITFHRTTDRGWSTVSEEHLSLARDAGKVSTGTIDFEVPALTIMDVIEGHVGLSPGLDLISLDIEGLDFDVLREIDFQKVRPKVLILENRFDKSSNTFSFPAIDFMRTKGYALYASTQVNSIFIDDQMLAQIKY